MIKIIANDGIDKSAKEFLESKGYEVDTTHYEIDELKTELTKAQILIVRSGTNIRKELIDEIKESGSLKLIIRAGVGIDNIDYDYAESVGISVKNTPNSSSESVAELVIGQMFAIARNIFISNVTIRNGQWNKKEYKGIELNGKTLGLIGFGRIAQEVAKKANALGMKVQYYKRSGTLGGFDDYKYVDFDTLVSTSDFVSLHIPFEKGQKPLIGKIEMERMKDGVFIINTARGNAIDEEALIEMLDKGKIAAVALDVFKEEPVRNEKIMNHPKISLTPHIGASTKEAQKRIGDEIIEVIEKFKL
ncbi:MAG: D-2-hydroxyacid dehydrogenase [Clostridiales bacterium]|nr:D-2-hydroxyacid dehydrogenase [Clostridiales bacterium]